MILDQRLFRPNDAPTDIKVDNHNIPHIFETTLARSNAIVHDYETQTSHKERACFDSNIRWRYTRRPVSAEDSLVTIRTYNYVNPATVIMQNIPAEFGIDESITANTIRLLLEKGVTPDEIEQIKQQKSDIIEYYKEGFLYEVRGLGLQCEEADLSDADNLPEHIQNDVRVKQLRDKYLVFPAFPYMTMARTPESTPPLRVTEENNDTYYALSTTIPQNIDDCMSKTFIAHCIDYMLWRLDEQCGIKEIGLDTDIYYDYLIVENATLYLFLQLSRF